MIDNKANRENWGFNERVEKFCSVTYLDKYEMNFLSNYNLFNIFSENATRNIIIDVMVYTWRGKLAFVDNDNQFRLYSLASNSCIDLAIDKL
ncbi:hypothetical protein [Helicobacter trogontum]|uniref:Uncharacterized protein n=1 Tax=Helicobacter trogontum TaxID=50960 RepID=A0A4U8SAF2_9HELI|nr:hypothetical protein [Helicobacter trogontum]TLD83048.1 hypothetical protein LS81_006260 [Helicobacter trogontum]